MNMCVRIQHTECKFECKQKIFLDTKSVWCLLYVFLESIKLAEAQENQKIQQNYNTYRHHITHHPYDMEKKATFQYIRFK